MTPRPFRLLPDALLSAPVFGLSYLWVFAVQLGETAGLGAAAVIVRVGLLFVVNVLMFAFPYVTLRWICPHVMRKRWTALLLASVVVGAVVRGIAFSALLVRAGVADSLDLAYRIWASVSHMVVITVLLWFLVSEVRGLQARRRQLLAERDQLLSLQQVARTDLERLGDRTIEGIRRSILNSLDDFRASDSFELLARLRLTVDSVVRPLSRQLEALAPTWVPPQLSLETKRVDWQLAAREGLDPARIHPVIVTVALIWIGLPIHLTRYGWGSATALVATSFVVVPAFWIFRRIGIRLSAGRGAGIRALAFIVAVLAGGASLGLMTLAYMRDEPQPFAFVIVAPVLAFLISAPLAVAEAARDQNRELEAELMLTTSDLRWTLARAREQHRQQERALAHALHGRLQASLAAAIVRLDRAVARSEDDATLRAALQDEILKAIADLGFRPDAPEPIEEVVELTRRTWAGAAEISCSISPEVRKALTADGLCATAVNDLVPELAFNSFRHGKASTIDIRMELADPRTLALTVTDDGHEESGQTQDGLGTRLLDEASISWSRTRGGSLTQTICLLPCIPITTQ